jgi:hypothetical protein
MYGLGEIWRRVRLLLRLGEAARELDEEMRLHREMKERELVAGGVPADEARYAAARALGNATALHERGKDAWGWRWLEDFLQDLRFGADRRGFCAGEASRSRIRRSRRRWR